MERQCLMHVYIHTYTGELVDGVPLVMMTANYPLGWYTYDDCCPALPSIQPACGIFETVRRAFFFPPSLPCLPFLLLLLLPFYYPSTNDAMLYYAMLL